MTLFILNLSLAFLIAAFIGSLDAGDFASGFVAGFVILWALQPFFPKRSRYFKALPKAALYVLYVLWELVASSFVVAKAILSPKPRITPGIVAVPLSLKQDGAIFILANSITLTPGTLSLSVSQDKKTLYVHGMFIGDVAEFRKNICVGFERKISGFMN